MGIPDVDVVCTNNKGDEFELCSAYAWHNENHRLAEHTLIVPLLQCDAQVEMYTFHGSSLSSKVCNRGDFRALRTFSAPKAI